MIITHGRAEAGSCVNEGRVLKDSEKKKYAKIMFICVALKISLLFVNDLILTYCVAVIVFEYVTISYWFEKKLVNSKKPNRGLF